MLTSGKFLVSFEVPGPLPGTTEGFCEEMNVVYRTEELNTYLRYPKQEINPWHKHSTYIRLKLREILKVNLTDITIIDNHYHEYHLSHNPNNTIRRHHPNPHTQ